MTIEQDKKNFNRNPEGKGGFQDHPESINKNGRPPKEESLVYWIKFFLSESEPGHKKKRIRELAEKIVIEAFKGNTKLITEVLDRVDGKPIQALELNNRELLMTKNTQINIFNLKEVEKKEVYNALGELIGRIEGIEGAENTKQK